MTSLPASPVTEVKSPGEHPASPAPNPHSASTRAVPRVYPWMLVLSTATAALFCLMYITKPVILTSSAPPNILPAAPAAKPTSPAAKPVAPTALTGLLPGKNHLPGDQRPAAPGANPASTAPGRNSPGPSSTAPFEETNLRIQHILTAESPVGPMARIDLDVPVLYQSRTLRWTPDDVAEARNLLVRLMNYQEKSQRLRAEGSELLDSWNRLLNRSLPAADLRADSPSLPTNQEDAADAPRPAGLITTESIQIQPAGK